MLNHYGVDTAVQSLVAEYHDRALEMIASAVEPSKYRDALQELAERLVERSR